MNRPILRRMWKCPYCVLTNFNSELHCKACFTPNPHPPPIMDTNNKTDSSKEIVPPSGTDPSNNNPGIDIDNEDEKKEQLTSNTNENIDNNFDYYSAVMAAQEYMANMDEMEQPEVIRVPPDDMVAEFKEAVSKIDLSNLFGFNSSKSSSKPSKQPPDTAVTTTTTTTTKTDQSTTEPSNPVEQTTQTATNELDETEILEHMEFESKLTLKSLTLQRSSNIPVETTIDYCILNENAINTTDPSQPVLFFIHGVMDCYQSWFVLLKQLMSYQGCMIAINLPPNFADKVKGVNNETDNKTEDNNDETDDTNDTNGTRNDLNNTLEYCINFLDVLGIKKCIWIGHNIGSFICQMAAINESSRVHKLILIGTNHCVKDEYIKNCLNSLKLRLESDFKVSDEDKKEFIKMLMEIRGLWDDYSVNEVKKDWVDGMVGSIYDKLCKNDGFRQGWIELINSMKEFDSLSMLKHIECECNVFVSRNDIIFDEKQKYGKDVNKQIQKSMMIPVGGNGGHYCHFYRNVANKMRLIIWDFARQQ